MQDGGAMVVHCALIIVEPLLQDGRDVDDEDFILLRPRHLLQVLRLGSVNAAAWPSEKGG